MLPSKISPRRPSIGKTRRRLQGHYPAAQGVHAGKSSGEITRAPIGRSAPVVCATCRGRATVRVYWPPTLAGDPFPVYCARHAAAVVDQVYAEFGFTVTRERIRR